MQIVGRVPAHGAQIVTIQNVQRFDQRRSLAPETGLINLYALKRGSHRILGLQVKRRHVFVAQQALILAAEGVNAARNIAAIKIIAHGVDGGNAICARGQRFLLGLGHGAQRACQIGLAEDLARHRHAIAR